MRFEVLSAFDNVHKKWGGSNARRVIAGTIAQFVEFIEFLNLGRPLPATQDSPSMHYTATGAPLVVLEEIVC